MATDGPLTGEILHPVLSLSSFDWVWKDFYPQSEFFVPGNSGDINRERYMQISRFVEWLKFITGHNYY
ncbi:MAG: hypothetical protein MUO67_12185 [Anaerolineales bacterium]|nr:hypothetical protein [Anaerolineales bacterium]